VDNLTGTTDNGKVTLSWTDPADNDFDHIEITFNPGGSSPVSVAKETQTRAFTGLTNGTSYTFTVKTVDTLGHKSTGTTFSGKPQASTGSVSVVFNGLPEDQTITLTGADGTLSWAANTTLTVNANTGFYAYRWDLDGNALTGKTNSSLILYAGELSVKQHRLTVFVTKAGKEYAKCVIFTVEE
jgi:hypothetical protein